MKPFGKLPKQKPLPTSEKGFKESTTKELNLPKTDDLEEEEKPKFGKLKKLISSPKLI